MSRARKVAKPAAKAGDARGARAQADAGALLQMIARGGRWAAYQNQDLGSTRAGHLQFLRVGPECSHAEAPPAFPSDTENGMGWRYRHVGFVNLETGLVEGGIE